MTIFVVLGAGAAAGAVMLLLSHLAPWASAGNFIRDLDQPVFRGKAITRREAHVLGILSHLLVSIVAAGLFGAFVQQGLFSGFRFVPIAAWSLLVALFEGGVILPLEGHGLFGLKEDAWFPIDLAVSRILWGLLFWWILGIWLNYVSFSP